MHIFVLLRIAEPLNHWNWILHHICFLVFFTWNSVWRKFGFDWLGNFYKIMLTCHDSTDTVAWAKHCGDLRNWPQTNIISPKFKLWRKIWGELCITAMSCAFMRQFYPQPPNTTHTPQPDLVGWLVIEVEHLYSALKQSINAVPARALSRTNHINAAHLSNSSSWAFQKLCIHICVYIMLLSSYLCVHVVQCVRGPMCT